METRGAKIRAVHEALRRVNKGIISTRGTQRGKSQGDKGKELGEPRGGIGTRVRVLRRRPKCEGSVSERAKVMACETRWRRRVKDTKSVSYKSGARADLTVQRACPPYTSGAARNGQDPRYKTFSCHNARVPIAQNVELKYIGENKG